MVYINDRNRLIFRLSDCTILTISCRNSWYRFWSRFIPRQSIYFIQGSPNWSIWPYDLFRVSEVHMMCGQCGGSGMRAVWWTLTLCEMEHSVRGIPLIPSRRRISIGDAILMSDRLCFGVCHLEWKCILAYSEQMTFKINKYIQLMKLKIIMCFVGFLRLYKSGIQGPEPIRPGGEIPFWTGTCPTSGPWISSANNIPMFIWLVDRLKAGFS